MNRRDTTEEGAEGMDAATMDRGKRTPANDLMRGALGAALGSVTRPSKEVLARRAEALRRAAAIEEAQAAETRAEEEAADREIEAEGDAEERPMCPRLHGYDVPMFLPSAEAAAVFLLRGNPALENGMRRDAAVRRRDPEAHAPLPDGAEHQHPDILAAMMRLAELRDAACVAGGSRGGKPRRRAPRRAQISVLDLNETKYPIGTDPGAQSR